MATNQQNSSLTINALKNLTTQIEIVRANSDPSKSTQITIVEIGEGVLVIEIDSKKVAVGHLVIAEGLAQINQDSLIFDAHGKIIESESLPGGRDKITIRMHKYDETLWKKIQNAQIAKQARVEELFNRVKGKK